MKKVFFKPNLAQNQGSMGFSLTEALVSAAAGAVVITAGTFALQSMGSTIAQSSAMENLQTGLTSAERILRDEVQRSLYLIVYSDKAEDEKNGLLYTNFNDEENHPEYKERVLQCKGLASESNPFTPWFGLKFAELTKPVLYGVGVSSNGNGYALLRCGEPLNADGRYETETPILVPLLENIGGNPCPILGSETCKTPPNLEENVNNFTTSIDSSSWRSQNQPDYGFPALVLETDSARKLLKIIPKLDRQNNSRYSFLQLPGSMGAQSIDSSNVSYIDMIAYAKADSVLRNDTYYSSMSADSQSDSIPELSCTTGAMCGFYGIPVTTNNIQFVVDGSGSMSACIAWGSTYNSTSRTFYNGSSFASTKRNCLMTRMEALQQELRNLINSLPASASISIRAFSSKGYANNRDWMNGNLMPLNQSSNRTSALDFVTSLSNGKVTEWGGTNPWTVLNTAFSNSAAQSLYILTDGDPNFDMNNSSWTPADYQSTAEKYIGINRSRPIKLSVNSVSIGLESTWLKLISEGASGVYKMINQAYTAVQ